MKYRKKPVVIDAWKWDGSREMAEVLRLCGCKCTRNSITFELVIHTLEGNMLVNLGDWIIKGVAGEFYPCKPEIFEATYEPVEEEV